MKWVSQSNEILLPHFINLTLTIRLHEASIYHIFMTFLDYLSDDGFVPRFVLSRLLPPFEAERSPHRGARARPGAALT